MGVESPWDDSTPPPLHGGLSHGYPPLLRPRGPPPLIPLRGAWGPLRRPRGPKSLPPLPRVLPLPISSGLPFFTIALSVPHGGPHPPLSAAAEVDFPQSLLPALASACSPLAPISCVPHCNAVSGVCSPSSFFVPASDVASLPTLYPLHPSLLASPAPPPPTSQLDGQGCRVLVVGGWVRAPWKISQESLRSFWGRHKPPLVLTLTPAVAPSALLPSVTKFARL